MAYEQYTDEQIGQAVKQKYPGIYDNYNDAQLGKAMKAKTSQAAVSQPQYTSSSPVQSSQEQPGVLQNAADSVNAAYDFYKNLPIISQARQGVGYASAGLGGIVGGITGGAAQGVKNLLTPGRQGLSGVAEAASKGARDTSQFGYQIGSEGGAVAPLGFAGKVPNAMLALTQGYQGGKDIIGGVKTGDPSQSLQGALELGASVFAGRGTIKSKGALVNQKALVTPLSKDAYNAKLNQAANIYSEILHPTQGEIQNLEVRSGKDLTNIYRVMAENKVIPQKGNNNRLETTDAADTLRQKMIEPSKQLSGLLAARPDLQFNMSRWLTKLLQEIDRTKLSALEKNARKADAKEIVAAELEQNGSPFIGGPKANEIKQGLWAMSFNQLKPNANKVARQLGHIIKEDIVQRYDDPKIDYINKELGNYADAVAVLENAHGRTVQGGLLAKKLSGIVGAIAASKIPFVGPFAGYYGGQRIEEMVTSPERRAQKAVNIMSEANRFNPKQMPQSTPPFVPAGLLPSPRSIPLPERSATTIQEAVDNSGSFMPPKNKYGSLLKYNEAIRNAQKAAGIYKGKL